MRQLRKRQSIYGTSASRRSILLLIAFIAGGGFSSAACGQCELQTIWSPDGGPVYYFGYSAAGSANMEVIILGEFGFNNLSGAAHVYRYDGTSWEYEAMLVAPDGPESGGQFARHVDMSADGKTVIISELADNNNGFFNAGAVWVFVEKAGKWVMQQKLTASDAENSWYLAEKLALSADGNVVVASATGAPGNPVYVFTRVGVTWTEAEKLQGNNGFFSSLPWVDVSADGSVIAVGSTDDSDQALHAGTTYIFVRSKGQGSWLFRQKIFASDALEGESFGRDVSLSATGDTILIGDNGDGEAANDAGAAYIFQREGDMWFEQFKLMASDPQSQDHFGAWNKITPDGQRAIIYSGNGSAYVFDNLNSEWAETMRLVATDLNVKGIGKAIVITDDGTTCLLGAPNSTVDGVFWYGAAVFFDLEAPLGDADCDGSITIADLLALLSDWGSCDDCEFFGGCPADLNLDCAVGISDLLILFSNWG